MFVQEGRDAPLIAKIDPVDQRNTRTALSGKRALIVEDDEMLTRFLARMLDAEGLQVTVAHDGFAAAKALSNELDVVLLDLHLPGLDGLSFLSQLRVQFGDVPVLVLTASTGADCVVNVLERGADDCLSKPFSYAELVARLGALLRRRTQSQDASPAPRNGELTLHPDEFRVTRNGRHIDLTPREFGLLEYLMRSPGKAVPRSVLLQELWGENSDCGSNVVDVYMKYVRDKIELPGFPKLIRTVRGIGYAIGGA